MSLKVDFTATCNIVFKSTLLNVGYFILQRIYHDLEVKDFFHEVPDNSQ